MKARYTLNLAFAAALVSTAAIAVNAQHAGRGYVAPRPAAPAAPIAGSGGAPVSGGTAAGGSDTSLPIRFVQQGPASGRSIPTNGSVPTGGGTPSGGSASGNAGQSLQFGPAFSATSAFGSVARGVGYGFGDPLFASSYGGYGYGGYGGYGYNDPTLVVTPYGVHPINGGNSGYDGNSDWQMLQSLSTQAYENALGGAAPGPGPAAGSTINAPASNTAATRPAYTGRVPHGSDTVSLTRVGKREILLRWKGDPRIASSVTFELTDASGRALRRTTVDNLPAEVHFTPPANATFYQVKVHYVDGATNTIMSRLPR